MPNGISNPLTNVPREPDGTHNCDTDLIYSPEANELWVYYVWEKDSPRGTPSELRRIKVGLSGSSFLVAPYDVCAQSNYQYDLQSPAIVRKSANEWLMWSNNSDHDNGEPGWKNQNAFVELRTSPNGKDWSAAQSLKQSLVLKGSGDVEYYIPWHLDVQWIESQNAYWGLFCAYPKGGNTNRTYLLFGTSANGTTWTVYPTPIISPRNNQWDNNFIYRSTFTYEPAQGNAADRMRIWYSGGESQGWRIAYTEFENFLSEKLPTLGTPYTPEDPSSPSPELSWIEIPASDDTNIHFRGSWTYEGPNRFAGSAGASATLYFYGSGVRYYAQTETNFGEVEIQIDDGAPEVRNLHSNTPGAMDNRIYEKLFDEADYHRIVIRRKNGNDLKSNVIDLNKFEVCGRIASEAEAAPYHWVDVPARINGNQLSTDIQYDNGWITNKLHQEDPSCHTQGARASHRFYGTGVRYFAQKDTNFGVAVIKILRQNSNGEPTLVEQQEVNLNGAMALASQVYEKTGLPLDQYTITVEPKNGWATPQKNVIDIQKFQVYQPDLGLQPAATPRMPVDEEHPLLLVSLYANTKHPAWWDDSGIPGVPMQGHNTMEGVWNLIPDDIKPYTAIQLHADDYLGHAWGGTGNKQNLQSFYEYHVAIAQEKGINIYLTLMTGGVPIDRFRNLIDMNWLNHLIDRNSCIKGVVFAENHHNGNTDAVAELTAEYLELFSSKGIYLVLTDVNNNQHRMEKWFENDTLFNTAQKHHKYLVINSKSTSSTGFNTVRSFALGTWLSGLADNWGALTDAWTWYESHYHKLFANPQSTTYEDVRRVYTFPETLFAMNMLQSYANGGTVFNAEHPFYCTGVYDEASWALKESIIPAMRYIIAHPAATRDQVKSEIKAVYHTDNYLPANFAEGLYGTANDSNLLQTSGRYRTLPLLSKKISAENAAAFGTVLRSADLGNKVSILNNLYPQLSTGDAFVEPLIDGGNNSAGRRLLIMNGLFNQNQTQSAALATADATFATNMGFTLTPHTYIIAHESSNRIAFDINNFRTDKDELWVAGESSNPDWTSYGNDWNGDHKDYVQDYMRYNISNPKLDKARDLRNTVITLNTAQRPRATVTRIGGSSKLSENTFYTETYVNGVYTLTITHNGQARVTIDAQ